MKYQSSIETELSRQGLLNRRIIPTIKLLEEILSRLSLYILLKPADLFTIRTVQESSQVKRFIEDYDRLPQETQRHFLLLNEKGKLLFAIGDFVGAIQTFAQAVEQAKTDEERAVACFNECQSLLQQNELDAAFRSYQQAMKLAPEKCQLFASQIYVPEKILGVNSWGISFLCRHEQQFCVVDCLLGQSTKMVEELFRGLKQLKDVHSPYICKLQEICYLQEQEQLNPYIVSDFIDAPDLQYYVETNGELTETEVIPFLKKIARGLKDAHDNDILHLDLRPKNIRVIENGDDLIPIITNFGLAVPRERLKEYQISLSKKGASSLSNVEMDILDAIKYASPEQNNELIQGRAFNLGTYSDVYSFGKTIDFLLFKTTKVFAQHWQKLSNQALQELLEKCQIKNPKNRHQNIEVALSALSSYSLGYEHYQAEEYQLAWRHFREAATEENHPLAQFALYLMYWGGEGVKLSEARAESWKRQALLTKKLEEHINHAAVSGDAVAQLLMGYILRDGINLVPDYLKAFDWFRKAEHSKGAAAQINIAEMYRRGLGVAQDYNEAAQYYKKAAEKKHAVAEYKLGYMYCHGLGVAQDFKAALSWYLQAAEKGYASAQNNLGYLYRHGPAVARDYDQARLWDEQGLKQDYEQAVAWYQKAAIKGHPVAQTNLGLMFQYGLGVPQDYRQAYNWYQKAALKGYPVAQYALGKMYAHGWGGESNRQEAAKWYRKASFQNYDEAEQAFRQLLRSPSE